LEGADVQIREQPKHGLGRYEFVVGEIVGFLDRNLQQRSGRVVRLNDKTLTSLCEQQPWCVDYTDQHRIVDSDVIEHDLHENKGTPLQTN